jgi:hypothetical protein
MDSTRPPLTSELAPSLGGNAKIEDVDLTKLAEIVAFAATNGGVIDSRDATYADLTQDGRSEALVSVESDGTFGALGYFVVTMHEGWPLVIHSGQAGAFTRNGLRVTVEDNRLVEIIGIYGPADPSCCPSVLQRTTYSWNGRSFQIEGREMLPNTQKSNVSE